MSSSDPEIVIDLTQYETKTTAASKYQPIGNYLTEHQDLSGLQPKGNYATLTNGRVPYTQLPTDVTKTGDLTPYMKTADADNKYHPKTTTIYNKTDISKTPPVDGTFVLTSTTTNIERAYDVGTKWSGGQTVTIKDANGTSISFKIWKREP